MFVIEISGKNDNNLLVLSSVLFLHDLCNKVLSQIVLNVSESIALEKNSPEIPLLYPTTEGHKEH